MQLEVGKIYEGKVTGITKFGAFVELEPNTTGMVHISEIANTFVNEITDHIHEGETVKVKVLSVSDDGKVSLSIKKAVDMPPRPPRPAGGNFSNNNSNGNSSFKKPYNSQGDNRHSSNSNNNNRFSNRKAATLSSGPATFEDMLSKFKQNSEEKISDLKKNIDNKRHGGSRRSGPKM